MPHRVLVIEDNTDTAHSTAFLLETCGYEVACAHSGDDGLLEALKFRPQAVVLDLGLPGVDGFEVARSLRKHSRMKDIYIVVVSGYATEPDRAKARASGVDDHLQKPTPFAALEKLLKQHLEA